MLRSRWNAEYHKRIAKIGVSSSDTFRQYRFLCCDRCPKNDNKHLHVSWGHVQKCWDPRTRSIGLATQLHLLHQILQRAHWTCRMMRFIKKTYPRSGRRHWAFFDHTDVCRKSALVSLLDIKLWQHERSILSAALKNAKILRRVLKESRQSSSSRSFLLRPIYPANSELHKFETRAKNVKAVVASAMFSAVTWFVSICLICAGMLCCSMSCDFVWTRVCCAMQTCKPKIAKMTRPNSAWRRNNDATPYMFGSPTISHKFLNMSPKVLQHVPCIPKLTLQHIPNN